ncbi:hypothetical protein [Piscirickettsia salmonis]|uniref:hypothetical protein n=1 Tax=Piscirickettsia salmonis TaxID=1238 RepID=UPI0002E18226|nr:hypothetical protein [Piscirickettsia salmonis]APS56024.1 hypothetical protein AVI52_01375 [Piscirickettsia salmonis]ERL61496.1 hypothetical protein K661_02173 [Piscirickettsia salmonis LF-89 = ATCC VR-1361]PEQ16076.1 hypothetical protein X973_09485 [Piscirickettsia salmonis]QGN77250.1 hypothetical protein Psal001_01456 [Piscirickettsia salmonis]QGN80851.1 hypothetical protein Psal002_01492 [Piscirickettsia salmonis]
MNSIIEINDYLSEDDLFSSFLHQRRCFYKKKLNIQQNHHIEIIDQTSNDLLFTRSQDITVLEKSSSGKLLAKYLIEKRGHWFGYDKYDDFGRYLKSEIIVSSKSQ